VSAAVPQSVCDAPIVARMLAARPAAAWKQVEIARALGWPISRLRGALGQLRREGALIGNTIELRQDYPLPPVEGAWEGRIVVASAMRVDGMREMIALHERSKREALSLADSERLGTLILREQRQAQLRPERIRRLREELELLETLEAADRGAQALPEEDAEIVAVQGGDGSWSAARRAA
jgi:hypothetical protein